MDTVQNILKYISGLATENLFSIGSHHFSMVTLIEIGIPFLLSWIIGGFFTRFMRKRGGKIWKMFGGSRWLLEILVRIFVIVLGLSAGFKMAGIDYSIFTHFYNLLFHPFFTIGTSPISIMSIVLLLFAVSASVFIASYIQKVLSEDVFPYTSMDESIKNITNKFVKYLLVVVGVVIGLQINGIDLSAFATIGAGLMVGLGFGLQNIANNFISGIIILVERPIKVGDYVEVGNVYGVISDISTRSTSVVTRENISMIIPNSKFISENVINWSHNTQIVELRIPIGISYMSDPEKAREVLIQIAIDNPEVLTEPAPKVLLIEFGDSSINMELEAWIENATRRFDIISDVNYAIYSKFKENGIIIPFPQRDVHIYNKG